MTRQIGINDLKRGTAKTPVTAPNWNNNIDVIRAAHNETDTALEAVESAITIQSNTINTFVSTVNGTISTFTTDITDLVEAIVAPVTTPNSVNSAKVNASGYADFIAKVSDTSVVHYAGGSNPNIVETDVLGRTHTITADETITGMTNNDTYEMLKEYDLTTGVAIASAPVAVLTANVSEAQVLPSAGAGNDGKYITITGVQPNRQYKGVSSAWNETTFIRRGQVTKTAGTMGTPVSRPFNYNPYGNALKNTWVSGEYLPVLNTPTVVTHNLNLPEPLLAKGEVLLKCTTAEGGYSVGDYAISPMLTLAAQVYSMTPLLSANAIQQNTAGYAHRVLNKASGAYVDITLANWRYVFKINY